MVKIREKVQNLAPNPLKSLARRQGLASARPHDLETTCSLRRGQRQTGFQPLEKIESAATNGTTRATCDRPTGLPVMPAKAGIQHRFAEILDSRWRGNDTTPACDSI